MTKSSNDFDPLSTPPEYYYDDMLKSPLLAQDSSSSIESMPRHRSRRPRLLRLIQTLGQACSASIKWLASQLSWSAAWIFCGSLATLTSLMAIFSLWHSGQILDHLNQNALAEHKASSPSSHLSNITTPWPSDTVRNSDNIALILKTGSATIYDRLPLHFQEGLLTLNKPSNVMFVSDVSATVAGVEIWDALAGVSERIASEERFAELYAQAHDLWYSHQSVTNTRDSKDGWDLDKYKFVPMMAEAWRRFSHVDWYIVVEADTFLFFNQMVDFLQDQDPTEQIMLGHRLYTDFDEVSTVFAHGGSGFVVSKALMQASFGSNPDFEHENDDIIFNSGYGDAILSKVFWDAPDVTVTDLHDFDDVPSEMLHGDSYRDLLIDQRALCSPVMTYHHVSNRDIAELYHLYRGLTPKLPKKVEDPTNFEHLMLHLDIWNAFAPPPVQDALRAHTDSSSPSAEVIMDNWEALDHENNDVSTEEASSAEECQILCEAQDDCLMWSFFPTEETDYCKLAKDAIRIGQRRPPPREGSGPTSGWQIGRVHAFIGETECAQRPLL